MLLPRPAAPHAHAPTPGQGPPLERARARVRACALCETHMQLEPQPLPRPTGTIPRVNAAIQILRTPNKIFEMRTNMSGFPSPVSFTAAIPSVGVLGGQKQKTAGHACEHARLTPLLSPRTDPRPGCADPHGEGGGGGGWQSHAPSPNHPHTQNQKVFLWGKVKFRIESQKMRGPFEVHKLFLALIPTH